MKYYGILMERKSIDDLKSIYTPIYILEGTIENYEGRDYFVDSINNSYCLTENPESMENDYEKSVCFVASEEELLEKYPDLDIEDIKAEYLASIQEYVWFGKLIEDGYDRVILSAINLDQIFNSIKPNVEANAGLIETDQYSMEEMKIIRKNIEKLLYPDNIEKQEYDEEINYENVCDVIIGNLNVIDSKTNKEEIDEIISITAFNMLGLSEELQSRNADKKTLEFVKEFINKLSYLCEINDVQTCKNEAKEFIYKNENKISKMCTYFSKEESTEKEIKKFVSDYIKDVYEMVENIINVSEMKEYLDKYIIGQEEAKKDVIQALLMNQLEEEYRNKNNVLLIGPTGSGKTLIADVVSRYLDKPMVLYDTTQLTTPGYKGSDLDEILVRLINEAGGDLEKAEKGIVVFDEIDKKGDGSEDKLFGKDVLNTLLPFIEGTTYDITLNPMTKVSFDTSKLTIFATGAFANVASKMKENKNTDMYKSNKIGFGSNLDEKNDDEEDIKYDVITNEDLIKYGKMPAEFIGRITTITQLSGHTKNSLKEILINSKISALSSEIKKLKKMNIDVTYDEEYLDAVAQEALRLKTGARSLKTIVEKSIKEARWHAVLSPDKYSKIVLTKESVLDNKKCMLVYKNGKKTSLENVIEKEKVKTLRKGV